MRGGSLFWLMLPMILAGAAVLSARLWLSYGWAPIYPECASSDGPEIIEGPLDPVFADNYELELRFEYGDAAVSRLSPTEIVVKAPIAAFDDVQMQAYLTSRVVHAIARKFWPDEEMGWRNLIGCTCATILAVPESESHILVNGFGYPLFGAWSDSDPWAERLIYRDKPVYESVRDWPDPVWRDEALAASDLPLMETMPESCASRRGYSDAHGLPLLPTLAIR